MLSRPRALIIDLDQTLVDSRCAKLLRTQRRWSEVQTLIQQFAIAPGAIELGTIPGLRIAVVTKSPSTYANAVLQHFRIRFDALVTYHDSPKQKPHPAPTLKALALLGIDPEDAWAAGDHADDLVSARAAGIKTLIGITAWADSLAELASAMPSVSVTHPIGVVELLRQ